MTARFGRSVETRRPDLAASQERQWTEFKVTAALVLAASGGALIACAFNDWSRLAAALGLA